MSKMLMYRRLQIKNSKPNFFSTPKLEKASWMRPLWPISCALVFGRGSLLLVGIPQGYAMGRGSFPPVQQRKKTFPSLRLKLQPGSCIIVQNC